MTTEKNETGSKPLVSNIVFDFLKDIVYHDEEMDLQAMEVLDNLQELNEGEEVTLLQLVLVLNYFNTVLDTNFDELYSLDSLTSVDENDKLVLDIEGLQSNVDLMNEIRDLNVFIESVLNQKTYSLTDEIIKEESQG